MKRKLSGDDWIGILVVGMTVISLIVMVIVQKISQ
jgi:hypothetical protein